jgi:hypothetical protein
MTYFSKFPFIQYDSYGDGEYKVTPNILRRVSMRTQAKKNAFQMKKYNILAGETPESVAHFLYGDTRLHWVILISNGITDRFHGWPLTEGQLMSFVNDKYDNPNAVHHYEINQESGDTSIKIDIGTDNTDYLSSTPITNYEYEVNRQNELSEISVLNPEHLQQFIQEFDELIKESVL